MSTPEEQLIYLFNHIFLPPNLPAGDEEIEDLHFSLEYLNTVVEEFSELLPETERRVWSKILNSVAKWPNVYTETAIDEKKTTTILNNLKADGMCEANSVGTS